MFSSYIKIAFRNLRKRKGYSLINIIGLAIGIACCILILLYIRYEVSYDRYHEQADNIYRVERSINFDGQHFRTAVTANPYAAALKADIPDVDQAVRVRWMEMDFQDHNRQYNTLPFVMADSGFFHLFGWRFLEGDRRGALDDPFEVVLTKSLAERYFPGENPVGKSLVMQWGKDYTLKITGVIEDIPGNSHFQFDLVASHATIIPILGEEWLQRWFSNNVYTYLLLHPDSDVEQVEAKLPAWMEKHMGNRAKELMGPDVQITDLVNLKLRPMTDIHLYSDLENEIAPGTDIGTVTTLTIIAVLVLLIACINFMNLATARSLDRAREVGLRKMAGAGRRRLVMQFLGETIILTLLSVVLAVILLEAVFPVFRNMTGLPLGISYFSNPVVIPSLLACGLLVGILAGAYPAFVLSGFPPITVLKGNFKTDRRGVAIRKILVVAQFSISIALIISTLIIRDQLGFLQQSRLGFNKEQVVVIPLRDAAMDSTAVWALKTELRRQSGIAAVATGSQVPGDRLFDDTMFRKDYTKTALEDLYDFQYYHIDSEYLPAMDIELAAGRNFSREFSTDRSEGYIINEAAMRKLGFASPEEVLGHEFGRATAMSPLRFKDGRIVGVVKNFHFKSLHHDIEPLVLEYSPTVRSNMVVRISTDQISAILAKIEETMRAWSPTYPFDYVFQDAYFDRLYRSEEQLRTVFGYFTFLAIIIACMGLFGLAAFTVAQRTREIGVRKVLGATSSGIAVLLSTDFLKWVAIANLIAWPFSWWLMTNWLQDFAYRIDLGIMPFLIGGLGALVIALLTVGFQSLRAAWTNPADALRYE